MTKPHLYKVIFYSQGKIYEVYAKNIHQSGMFGKANIMPFPVYTQPDTGKN